MIFRPELAAAIVRGEKTATRRRVSDNPRSPWRPGLGSYRVGQFFAINPGRGKARVADVRVTGRRVERLGLARGADAAREGFSSLPDFRIAWSMINGVWEPNEMVHVVEFNLEGPGCGGCDACGWCEGSPAWTCTDCFGTGFEPSPAALALIAALEKEKDAAVVV